MSTAKKWRQWIKQESKIVNTMKLSWRMKSLRSQKSIRISCRLITRSKNKVLTRRNQLFGEKKQYGALNLSSFMTRIRRKLILKMLPSIKSNRFKRNKNHENKTTMIVITMKLKIGGTN